MNHEQASELLWEYRDGELDPAATAEAALHIADCPECGRQLARMQELSRRTRAELERPAGEEFVAGVMSRVRLEKPPALRRLRIALFGPRPALQLALAGALCAALVVAALHSRRDTAAVQAQTSALALYQAVALGEEADYSYDDAPALDQGYSAYFLSDTQQ